MALAMEDTTSTFSLEPFMEIKEKNKNIINVHMQLKGNITDYLGNSRGPLLFGKAHVHVFNQDWISEPVTDYIDSVIHDFSGNVKAYYRNLRHMLNIIDLENIGIRNTIANLNYLAINPASRGQGLGRLFLQMITQCIKSHFKANYMVLESSPLEINRLDIKVYQKELQRLDHMYTKFGFSKMPVKGIPNHFMYLNLDKMTPLS
jgi:GNAT superfamily N-acetyltransferase